MVIIANNSAGGMLSTGEKTRNVKHDHYAVVSGTLRVFLALQVPSVTLKDITPMPCAMTRALDH